MIIGICHGNNTNSQRGVVINGCFERSLDSRQLEYHTFYLNRQVGRT